MLISTVWVPLTKPSACLVPLPTRNNLFNSFANLLTITVYIQLGSLLLASSLMNFYILLCRLDYIIFFITITIIKNPPISTRLSVRYSFSCKNFFLHYLSLVVAPYLCLGLGSWLSLQCRISHELKRFSILITQYRDYYLIR